MAALSPTLAVALIVITFEVIRSLIFIPPSPLISHPPSREGTLQIDTSKTSNDRVLRSGVCRVGFHLFFRAILEREELDCQLWHAAAVEIGGLTEEYRDCDATNAVLLSAFSRNSA
jgi:hypothetical protein